MNRATNSTLAKLVNSIEKKIGYEFNNKELIISALIHKSYSNENIKYKDNNNEKLELLGDTVLNIITTEYLYFAFKNFSEGELVKLRSKIVSEPILASFAHQLDLGEYLLLSKGEVRNGGKTRPSILADAFEALLGAFYIDAGIERTKEFLTPFLTRKVERIHKDKMSFDYKTVLQEHTQFKYKNIPEYIVTNTQGPDHMKMFTVAVELNNEIIGIGNGKSKKEAEQSAARNACKKLEIKIEEGSEKHD